jgi:hypothetical protein
MSGYDQAVTDFLSRYVDNQDDEMVRRKNLLTPAPSPREVLYRLLRPSHGQFSADALGAYIPPAHAIIGFRKIGDGQSAVVCHRPGREIVVKIARPRFYFQGELWPEFLVHNRVYHALLRQGALLCRVPMAFEYVSPDNHHWWQRHQALFPADVSVPSAALVTERILPLPKTTRTALVRMYCPQHLQQSDVLADPANRDCLARVYLGKRRARDTPLVWTTRGTGFSLQNFPLHLDQMIELDLPVCVYAMAMAETLAILHWDANVDGNDIEFVLGSEANTALEAYRTTGPYVIHPEDLDSLPGPCNVATVEVNTLMRPDTSSRILRTRMWVLDFSKCKWFDESWALQNEQALIDHLVRAFYDNDPYFPRPAWGQDPERTLWETFREEYLLKSWEILKGPGKAYRLAYLPRIFLDACEVWERTLRNN